MYSLVLSDLVGAAALGVDGGGDGDGEEAISTTSPAARPCRDENENEVPPPPSRPNVLVLDLPENNTGILPAPLDPAILEPRLCSSSSSSSESSSSYRGAEAFASGTVFLDLPIASDSRPKVLMDACCAVVSSGARRGRVVAFLVVGLSLLLAVAAAVPLGFCGRLVAGLLDVLSSEGRVCL